MTIKRIEYERRRLENTGIDRKKLSEGKNVKRWTTKKRYHSNNNISKLVLTRIETGQIITMNHPETIQYKIEILQNVFKKLQSYFWHDNFFGYRYENVNYPLEIEYIENGRFESVDEMLAQDHAANGNTIVLRLQLNHQTQQKTISSESLRRRRW